MSPKPPLRSGNAETVPMATLTVAKSSLKTSGETDKGTAWLQGWSVLF